MCGIAGIKLEQPQGDLLERLISMRDAMVHRGPDSCGEWVHPSLSMALGHRRLSIVELSPLGHQPMASSSGRYVITFNGEIYNFRQLRHELEALGCSFRGGSDTEVILASVEAWGLDQALSRFIGMFAFALWDEQEQKLFLVRDRIGKKPLYYLKNARGWAFASELKGLVKCGLAEPVVCRRALSLYMRYGYVPNPHAIYEGMFKVPPGSVVELARGVEEPVMRCYWDVSQVAERGVRHIEGRSASQIVSELETLLDDAVSMRMVADVPVGAFLSGGIDSSLIAALMQKHSTSRVSTYTIGFREEAYNEAQHARKVAEYLGTDHHEMFITERNLLDVLPGLPEIVDEPLADISILPTYLVSKLASGSVKVVLSGDGGDELFCGYGHYARAAAAWEHNRRFGWGPLQGVARRLMASHYGGGRLARGGALLGARNQEELCSALISQWQRPSLTVVGGVDADREGCASESPVLQGDIRNYMMLRDMKRYLVDGILHKVDRASMAASIEARAPILDHRMIEYAWTVPVDQKADAEKGKLPLRAILGKYLPEQLYERPKQGFGVPISSWLRGQLREWADGLIHSDQAAEFFVTESLEALWREHLSCRHDRGAYLWNILLFLHWIKAARGDGG